ncbi:MAG TPA: hypothetical protein VMF58_08535 [Rhizomicrobium sp.]|nr:hypothetical protein [Rhizomicrobium sp.]
MNKGLALFVVLSTTPACAADFSYEGYGDFRLVAPPSTDSYLDGGLGKLRYGKSDETFQPGDIVGEGQAQINPDLMATATARINTQYGSGIDILDGYVRYHPVSTSDWLWSVKVGAFFPPISLENEQVGWSTFWTITPSAINSWIGNELRIIGAEGTLEWRRADGDITLIGAVFGWNDPAGVMMADRGWNFDDRYTGLIGHSRLPDAAAFGGATPPIYANLFTEIDNSPGWYLDLSWEPENLGGFEVMRYDNEADPTVIKDGQIAWHTHFWEVGYRKQFGRLTLLSQGMSGATTIEPSPLFHQTTDFKSAYALAGYDMDKWWVAARLDLFQTRTRASFPSDLDENGHAYTLSLSYLPTQWLRFTGEVLSVDDTRQERIAVGEAAHQIETQFQFLTRVYF